MLNPTLLYRKVRNQCGMEIRDAHHTAVENILSFSDIKKSLASINRVFLT